MARLLLVLSVVILSCSAPPAAPSSCAIEDAEGTPCCGGTQPYGCVDNAEVCRCPGFDDLDSDGSTDTTASHDWQATSCGNTTCAAGQACIEPGCCWNCVAPAGDPTPVCPTGCHQYPPNQTMCGTLCACNCTPPPPYCADIPKNCNSDSPCNCFQGMPHCPAGCQCKDDYHVWAAGCI